MDKIQFGEVELPAPIQLAVKKLEHTTILLTGGIVLHTITMEEGGFTAEFYSFMAVNGSRTIAWAVKRCKASDLEQPPFHETTRKEEMFRELSSALREKYPVLLSLRQQEEMNRGDSPPAS